MERKVDSKIYAQNVLGKVFRNDSDYGNAIADLIAHQDNLLAELLPIQEQQERALAEANRLAQHGQSIERAIATLDHILEHVHIAREDSQEQERIALFVDRNISRANGR